MCWIPPYVLLKMPIATSVKFGVHVLANRARVCQDNGMFSDMYLFYKLIGYILE